MRFAIWAAVSSRKQVHSSFLDKKDDGAGDKDEKDNNEKYSLVTQLESCRKAAESRGWVEAVEPYVAAGYSRTNYIDLSTAMKDIPALGKMNADAIAGKFDVVLTIDYDRFRDLVAAESLFLQNYRVQICSLNQWIDPQKPEEFDRYYSSTAPLMEGISAAISKFTAIKLQQQLQKMIPKRIIEKGLHPGGRIPYGYRRVSKDSPLEQSPLECEALLKAKDLVLDGESLYNIAKILTAEGYPTANSKNPVWHPSSLNDMLKNEFYTGSIGWRRNKHSWDMSEGKKKLVVTPSPERAITASGKHVPLWDRATRTALIKAMSAGSPHTYKVYRLTSIVRCSVCGKSLVPFHYHGKTKTTDKYRCIDYRSGHIVVLESKLIEWIIPALQASIVARSNEPAVFSKDSELKDLEARKARLVDALEVGALDAATYKERVNGIDVEIKKLEDERESINIEQIESAQIKAAFDYVRKNIDDFPHWFMTQDEANVNKVLRKLCKKIIVYKDHVEVITR